METKCSSEPMKDFLREEEKSRSFEKIKQVGSYHLQANAEKFANTRPALRAIAMAGPGKELRKLL